MSGIIPGLFGGSNATQSSQSSQLGIQSSTPSDFNPFAGLRDILGPTLGAMTQAGVGGFSPYQFGPAPTAGMGAAETAAMGDVASMATDPARRALLQQTMGGQFLPGQPGGNPFMQAAIEMAQRPTQMAMEQAIQRRIPGMFAAAGHTVSGGGSSPYMRELGLAAAQGGRALGDIATQMSSQAYDAERARQMQALQLHQGEIDQATKNFGAQALPRLIAQGGIEQGVQTGQQQLQSWLQALQLLGGVTSPNLANSSFGYQTGQSTSTGTSTMDKGIFPSLFPKGLQAG